MRLDRAVAWSIETRGSRVDIPLQVRFFAPDELELLDPVAATASPLRRSPDTGRLLEVLRDALAPVTMGAGLTLAEDVDEHEIGCLEYRSGPQSDPVALAVTHVPALAILRAELWHPARGETPRAGWGMREETWHDATDADPHDLARHVAATVGSWLAGLSAPSYGARSTDVERAPGPDR